MSITVYEVGLRDGLQNEAVFVETRDKLLLAQMLVDAGLPRIELTSFVHPKWIPQLRDCREVVERAPQHPGVRFSALVPNLRGLQSALQTPLKEIAVFMSATESHSQKNINKSVSEAVEVLSQVVDQAKLEGLFVRGYLSTVFGCPYEGEVDPGRAHEIVLKLLEMGIDELSLGDTIGVANPLQVRKFVERIRSDVPLDQVALHMHDTRGTALANVLSGLDAGVHTFDSAFGGLGGCPYAPGASGNLATEDLVYMLEGMGLSTGVDLDALILASEEAMRVVGRSLPSKVLQSELARRAPTTSPKVSNG